MKKAFLIFASLLSVLASRAQITLTESNYPLKAWSINTYRCHKLVPNPVRSAGKYWACDSTSAVNLSPIVYSKNNITSTFRGNSYYTLGTGTLVSIPYTVLTFWRENANGVFIIGDSVPPVTLDLATQLHSSAYAGDTIFLVRDSQVYHTDSIKIMSFPATYPSAWNSVTRNVLNFKLTLSGGTYTKAPSQHVAHIYHSDSIIGYGTMSVHTATFPYHSVHYPVLMDKVSDYNVDSFYINGTPAPSSLLTAFGLAQNEISAVNCRYNFYRLYNFQPLVIVNYAGDTTYSKQTSVQYHADSLTTATGIDEITKSAVSALIFPNPVTHAGNVTVQMLGCDAPVVTCRVCDVTGHEVLNTRISSNGAGAYIVPLSKELANGMYILQMADINNTTLLSESLMVQR